LGIISPGPNAALCRLSGMGVGVAGIGDAVGVPVGIGVGFSVGVLAGGHVAVVWGMSAGNVVDSEAAELHAPMVNEANKMLRAEITFRKSLMRNTSFRILPSIVICSTVRGPLPQGNGWGTFNTPPQGTVPSYP